MLKTLDFIKDPNEDFGKSKVSDLRSVLGTSYDYYYTQEVRNSSYLVYFPFLSQKWFYVHVLIWSPSPRLAEHCLGEDKRQPQEERSVHLGEGVRLGEGMYAKVNPRTRIGKFLVLLSEGVARLGEPLYLG